MMKSSKKLKAEMEEFIYQICEKVGGPRPPCSNLPENANEDVIEANLDKGLLKIKIPKKEIKKKVKKEIEIK